VRTPTEGTQRIKVERSTRREGRKGESKEEKFSIFFVSFLEARTGKYIADCGTVTKRILLALFQIPSTE